MHAVSEQITPNIMPAVGVSFIYSPPCATSSAAMCKPDLLKRRLLYEFSACIFRLFSELRYLHVYFLSIHVYGATFAAVLCLPTDDVCMSIDSTEMGNISHGIYLQGNPQVFNELWSGCLLHVGNHCSNSHQHNPCFVLSYMVKMHRIDGFRLNSV